MASTFRLPASPGTLLRRPLTQAPPSVPEGSRATPSIWLSSCLRARKMLVLVRVLQRMAASAVGRVRGGRMRCRRWKRHTLPGRRCEAREARRWMMRQGCVHHAEGLFLQVPSALPMSSPLCVSPSAVLDGAPYCLALDRVEVCLQLGTSIQDLY